VTIIAAFLPWYAGFGLSGIRLGSGQITALCGLAGLAFAFGWHGDDRGHGVFQLVLGAIVAYVGLSNLNTLSGMGLYATLIAGVAWFIAGMALAREYGLS
jgi:hypothetical protein